MLVRQNGKLRWLRIGATYVPFALHSRTLRVLPTGDHAGLTRPGRTLTLAARAALSLMMQAANYSARKTVVDGVDVVQLADAASHIEVSIAVSVATSLRDERRREERVLLSLPQPRELKAKPTQLGIPFLRRGPTASKRMRIG